MRLESVWAEATDRPGSSTRGVPAVRLHSVVNGVVVCGIKHDRKHRLDQPFNLTDPDVCRPCAATMLVSYV